MTMVEPDARGRQSTVWLVHGAQRHVRLDFMEFGGAQPSPLSALDSLRGRGTTIFLDRTKTNKRLPRSQIEALGSDEEVVEPDPKQRRVAGAPCRVRISDAASCCPGSRKSLKTHLCLTICPFPLPRHQSLIKTQSCNRKSRGQSALASRPQPILCPTLQLTCLPSLKETFAQRRVRIGRSETFRSMCLFPSLLMSVRVHALAAPYPLPRLTWLSMQCSAISCRTPKFRCRLAAHLTGWAAYVA